MRILNIQVIEKRDYVEQRIKEIIKSIESECYLSALALSLTIPDICGQIEYPDMIYQNGKQKGRRKGKDQYIRWFDEFVKPLFFINGEDTPKNQMDGRTCYALRCAYLHAGNYNLKEQNKEIAIDIFKLHVNKIKGQYLIHNSYHQENGNNIVDLDVYGFCHLITIAAQNYYSQKEKALFEKFDSVVIDKSWSEETYNMIFKAVNTID